MNTTPRPLDYRPPLAVNTRLPWDATATALQLLGIFSGAFGGLMVASFALSGQFQVWDASSLVRSARALLGIVFLFHFLVAGAVYFFCSTRIRRRSRRAVMVALVFMALQVGVVYSMILPEIWTTIHQPPGHWVRRVDDPFHVITLTTCFLIPPTIALLLLPRAIRLLRAG